MANPRLKKLASASFFCGLGSLILLIITGIPAVILGHRSNRVAKVQGRPRSGLAIAGIILGYLSFVTTLVLLFNVFGFFRGKTAFARYKTGTAREDVIRLVEAIEKYRNEYGVLPLLTNRQPMRTDEGALIDILIGNNTLENSRSIPFMDSGRRNFLVPSSGPGAALVDPWGNPYFVAMDTDGDGAIDDPIGTGRRIRGKAAIAWSAGPDGKIQAGDPDHLDNQDNIDTWN